MVETRSIQIAGVTVRFIRCPVGTFEMGSNGGLPIEQPTRRVAINQPFWIAETLVTQKLWVNVMETNPSTFNYSDELPVDGVSYDSAIDFCRVATEKSGVALTLPTEAQWEYACRAGTATEYFWGSDGNSAAQYGWFDMTAQNTTHEVASLAPNPWGLFDIVGNLWEWCADVWHSDYIGAPDTAEPWQTNSDRQPRRSLRGGAWDMDVFRLRSAYRSCDHRDLSTSRFGLRIAVAASVFRDHSTVQTRSPD